MQQTPLTSLNLEDLNREELQATVERRSRELAVLKLRLNALAPINRCLPPEVLAEIFLLSLVYAPRLGPPKECWRVECMRGCLHQRCHPPYAWIRIGHICHSWRVIALQSARLWSHIAVTERTNLDCVEEMLSRSQQAPLVVEVYTKVSTRTISLSVLVILAQLRRISSLDLFVPDEIIIKYFTSIQGAAPLLRTLSLDVSSFGGSSFDLMLPIPRIADRLERLAIHSQSLAGTQLLVCSSLKHLTMSSVKSTGDLLTALAGATLLQTLDLDLNGRDNDDPDKGSAAIVTLPNLRSLILRGRTEYCNQFLRHTTFPVTSILDVRPNPGVGQCITLISAIADKINGVGMLGEPQSFWCLTLTASADEWLYFAFQGWTTSSMTAVCKVKIELPMSHEYVIQLCAAVHLSEVSYLQIYRGIDLGRRDWHRVFAQMEKLETLKVDGAAAKSLADLLTQRLDGHDINWQISGESHTNSPRDHLFPGLRNLHLHLVFFRNSPDANEEWIFLHSLKLTLQMRKSKRAGLTRLTITEAVNFTRKDVDLLEPFVENIDWDGKEKKMGEGEGEEEPEEEEEEE
ncbi:hypothetical protein PHLCEN_2v11925 [Hermanssonia centrifuga]|uniref:Uncharacterized protein n=1 Tax=Hermanssonia centrifuga TaxID=98765 RepID=A0A2R6NIZ5_9APHY|nr:hypothetical protein PHLCEN_2v11925 [Hermanssonia centrifuga]